jgi:hypothetical protein
VSIRTSSGALGARWPDSGTSNITPKSSGPSIKILYVPLLDPSRTEAPDTSAEAMQKLDAALFAVFPTARIESSVHAPVSVAGTRLEAREGTGWGQALESLLALRQREHAAPNVYYYGLVAPAATFNDYCGPSCIGGVATMPSSPTEASQFAALGVSFQEPAAGYGIENPAARVALQELAHNFGRTHAPCSIPDGGTVPGGLDPNYPYPMGSIGVWGYDLVEKRMMAPADFADIQSYCNPVWISDYTYGAIFDWLASVNAGAGVAPLAVAADAVPQLSEQNLRYILFE